jgi:hypothetical protein
MKIVIIGIIGILFGYSMRGQTIVRFTSINSEQDEFGVIKINDSTMLISSDRYYPGSKTHLNDDSHTSHIYYVKGNDTLWSNPKKIDFDEPYSDFAIAGKSSDPNHIIIYNGGIGNGDLLLGKYFQGKITIITKIQFPGSDISKEIFGFWDQINEVIYVCSDREDPNKIGGFDIWKITFRDYTCGEITNLGEKINSLHDEINILEYKDILYFSSNIKGNFDIYSYDKKNITTLHQNSFDEVSFDPQYQIWCANPSGNFDIYYQKDKRDSISISILIADTISDTTKIDTIPITHKTNIPPIYQAGDDTIAIIDINQIDKIDKILDSIGFKMQYAYVQIGAYYYLHEEKKLRKYYNIKDTIKTEVILSKGKKMTKYLIDIKYTNISEAFEKQKECKKKYKLRDPIIVVYSEKERIMIILKPNKYIILK